MKHNIPVSLYVEEEGSNRLIVTYYYRTHIITVDEDYDTSLKTIEDTDFMDFSK
ncbi:MAG: hypothetical protein IJS61_06655 [Firmicutes bacterium]|nr:hypothetical protein [Bacillota bacterium]